MALNACKKSDPDAASPNEITLSINNATEVHYAEGTYNQATERNFISQVGFCRSLTSQGARGFIEMDSFDKSLFDQPIPYSVKSRFAYFSLTAIPYTGIYSFDNRSGTPAKGHLNLTFTYAKDQRVKGSYDGVVYNPYIGQSFQPDSISVKGAFDILVPAFYNH
ncbi:hypothetical protein KXQ82_03610 [Mucilaginibacter sp. HMF5004]|uniref:hypothetical protein n=1 Tax=Mucilaginibacter rivuli TaxID=2857527 RepID=UPI001C5D39D1|nr:hypothetical protein [Mucilaginibacter rivuli]MBW4888780.1 hypothetical protein [Mucilaginibacter rivuli]